MRKELTIPAINITDYDSVIHLSHTCLDGFSCSTLVYKAREGNVELLNATSRESISKAIDELVVKGESNTSGSLLILITDIYITKEQSIALDAVNTGNVNVRVIPTHDMEDAAVMEYPSWYYQNRDTAASALLYTAIRDSASDIGHLEEFVRAVSAYDVLDGDDWVAYESGGAIHDGLYMFIENLNKDDGYTRDIVIGYLSEIAKVVERGIAHSTPADVSTNVETAWRKAAGAKGEETVVNALARNLATRVLEDKDNRYNIKLDDVVYRCAVVGVLPFNSDTANEVLASKTCDVDLVVYIDRQSRFGFVYSKDDSVNFDVSDIAEAIIHGDIHSVITEFGFVKAE